ncbi:MAG: spore coat protein [Peptococcaceae bacterium]|nr:spore coat protein [Peptococcaceae bacterium]
MNDRDYLNDLLAMEKYLTDNLNIFAREASHRELHNTVMRILGETHQAARDTFNLMFRKGFYKLEVENPQHVAQTQQQFQNYRSQFPYNPATYT